MRRCLGRALYPKNLAVSAIPAPSRPKIFVAAPAWRGASSVWEDDEADDGGSEKKAEKMSPQTAIGSGLSIFAVGVPLLVLNERRHVKQSELREHAHDACKTVDIKDPQLLSHNDELIHTVGDVIPMAPLPMDEMLQLSRNNVNPRALRIKRSVQMFQMIETSQTTHTKGSDGKDVAHTTYSYRHGWSSTSQGFKNPQAPYPHNPPWPADLHDYTSSSGSLMLGPLKLDSVLTSQVSDYRHLGLEKSSVDDYEAVLKAAGEHHLKPIMPGGYLYSVDGNPSNAKVGDVKVSFEFVPEGEHTAVGKLVDGEVGPFKGPGSTKCIAFGSNANFPHLDQRERS